MTPPNFPEIPGKRIVRYIFRASFTVKGVTYYAKDYGYRAWRIPIYG